jgi:hypothetical protein
MRSVLVLGLLIAVSASAQAATTHHHYTGTALKLEATLGLMKTWWRVRTLALARVKRLSIGDDLCC